jgi:hypothetical protein
LNTGKLRLRITQPVSGSIDGIQLDRFQLGLVYEVGTTVGSYLLAIGAAEPAGQEAIAPVLPPAQQMFGPVARGHGHRLPIVRDRAADRADEPDTD